MARAPKIDAVLEAGVDLARSTLLDTVDAAQIGDHLGVAADADRVLTHRFEAKLSGYAGWNWFVTLARVPRGKVPTVCETGLVPGDGALLSPEWVPWADRIRPEERAAQQAAEAEATGTTAATADAEPTTEPSPGQHDGAAPSSADATDDAAGAPGTDGGTDVETVDTAASPDEPDEVVEDDSELEEAEHAAEEAPRRSRSRRRRR